MSPVRAWLLRHRAAVAVVVLVVLLEGANLLFTAHMVRTNAQQRCSSLMAEAAIPVPQPVAGNPSREWEAAYENIVRARARHLGCWTGAGS